MAVICCDEFCLSIYIYRKDLITQDFIGSLSLATVCVVQASTTLLSRLPLLLDHN